VPLQQPRRVPLSPSSVFDEDFDGGRRVGATALERRLALARGRIVHRLMQSLPDIPRSGRDDAIERYLKTAATALPAAEQADLARQVLTILNDLVFADVFAPGSRAEVPIVGRVAGADGTVIAVSGQVDRLAVTRDAVLIVDYKTDQAAPRRADDVPARYVTQLALYRAVLARIYPDKTVHAALLFTAGPHVVDLPGAAMDAALTQVRAAHQ
jgi:ATP-dependent helicase/nuclease subunit A